MIKRFLHTGFEVTELDQAVRIYEGLGFTLEKEFDKPEPEARVALMSSSNGPGLELWQFIDKKHPQVEYIRQHIALESDDLKFDIDELTEMGCELVIPVTEGVTLTYAFLRQPGGNYIELAQKPG